MPFLRWILLGLVAGCIGRNIVNKRGKGTHIHTVLGVVVVIAGEWLLRGPRRPPKTQRAGASIRLDERLDDAVSNYKRTPPPSSEQPDSR
jgi:uncharacterized membrane protein YeaQ/YmgE (transglycosylase-associated protein family)